MPVLRLKSSDNNIFITDVEIAKSCGIIRSMLECGIDVSTEPIVPLPRVSASILRKVLEWSAHHKDDELFDNDEYVPNDGPFPRVSVDITPWDIEFLKVDTSTLCELLEAANYLDNKGLRVVVAKTFANLIKGKTTQELRDVFDIEDDLCVKIDNETTLTEFDAGDSPKRKKPIN